MNQYYAVADKIANGATVTVLGRNENSSWLQIQQINAPADTGWVAAPYLQVNSPLDTLPVVTILTD